MSDSGTSRLVPPASTTTGPAGEFSRLVEIMRLLRSAQGCPWDREQSCRTLAPFVLEEAYEVVDAIERDNTAELCEEIGDLVFEGVFLAQVAADEQRFTIENALRSINEKLIRRHPHVFTQTDAISGADGQGVTTPTDVKTQWDEIKSRERQAAGKERRRALDGVPIALPGLTRAHELGRHAAKSGFDWPTPDAVLDKVSEEVGELRAEVAAGDARTMSEELGDLLFALAQFARKAGIDPEAALRAANRKFTTRFERLEDRVAETDRAMTTHTLDELEAMWQEIKRRD